MKYLLLLLALALTPPAQAGSGSARKAQAKPGHARVARSAGKQIASRPSRSTAKPATKSAARPAAKRATRVVGKRALKPVCKTTAKPAAKSASKVTSRSASRSGRKPSSSLTNEVAKPSPNDPEYQRIEALQTALEELVRGRVLGRLRVGMRVENLANGRVLFGWRSNALMDPASNQKVLATTAALLRLGNTFRYRTEVTGPSPDREGAILGNIVIRGSGDPSLRPQHIESLAEAMAKAGVTRVSGSVLGDPRRIGSDEYVPSTRAPLRVGGSAIEVRVRPASRAGGKPSVSVHPASESIVVVNHAETQRRGRTRLSVEVTRVGGRFQVSVGGRISISRGEAVLYRAPPSHSLYAAMLLRLALAQVGIAVQGQAGVFSLDDQSRISAGNEVEGMLLAAAKSSSDTPPPLARQDPEEMPSILALHESEPLPILLRRVNKNSDNEWAERVLETVGAEVSGGAPNTSKGLRVLREALDDMGIPESSFVSTNGSGLGHHNRVTAAGMTKLLGRLYFDPRVGPEILQSLSVGGVDGTTRNRFRGTSSAHRVRAKTGTLSGVSCLSGFVGDGKDVLVFSILVEGHRRRSVSAVRSAQVSAVNAMMHFSRNAQTAAPEEGAGGTDYETGDEVDEVEAPASDRPR